MFVKLVKRIDWNFDILQSFKHNLQTKMFSNLETNLITHLEPLIDPEANEGPHLGHM